MRRKPGTLLPIEHSILESLLGLERKGPKEYHGFLIAKQLKAGSGARRLTSHGTLYKALDRLVGWSLLERRWEEAAQAAQEGRPRRRLYRLTDRGRAVALEEMRSSVLINVDPPASEAPA